MPDNANQLGLTDGDIENLARHSLAQGADLAAEHYGDLDDYELIVASGFDSSLTSAMELNRRLKGAVRELSEVSIGDLTQELRSFHRSSDLLASRVVVLTRVLVVLTALIVALTVVPAVRPG